MPVQFEEWNAHSRLTLPYIKTRAKPPIFYLPSQHNESTQKRLSESQAETKGQQCSLANVDKYAICSAWFMRTEPCYVGGPYLSL